MMSPFDIEHFAWTNQLEANRSAEKARQLAELESLKPASQSLRGATARMFVTVGLKLDPGLALEMNP